MAVKKAIVLAAGLGTRLRPLTCATPKPLMPVWGRPIIDWTLDNLRRFGVEDVVVNCHYLHGQIERWCEENGCRASYEPEILGTGGVLNPLRGWIGSDDFLLVNGDIIVEDVPDLESALSSAGRDAVAAALVVEKGPRTIEVEPESGFVTCWKSPDPGWPGTFTYSGFALLRPAVLDYVEPSGFSSIVQAYERAMKDGRFVKAVAGDGALWSDVGTIDSYIEINTSPDGNGFAEIPQLKAAGMADPVEFLGARGSDRAFFRSGDRLAVVYDASKRGENARYAGHARWLAERGVPVPAVLADRPDMNVTAFAFAGSEDLAAQARRVGTVAAYTPVVEALAAFNALDASSLDLEPAFGPELWKWERGLFAEHCLGTRFGMEMSAGVEADLEKAAEVLEREPKALVHRDFQSTNVLWRNGRFSFIDFQGMREGPAIYDLASLLYDPYVRLTDSERAALAALYGKASGRGPEAVAAVLPFAAVERLAQALGAFGRLASVGQPQFGKFVAPALENLLAAADDAGLDAAGALAEDLLAKEGRRQTGGGAS